MNERLTPKTVLAVAAHADDIEFGASGAIATFAQGGAAVYYLILTDGGKGSSDHNETSEQLRDKRQAEQREALKILGGTDVFFLDYPDSHLEVTQGLKRDIVKIIRQVKPEVVITMDPTMVYSAKHGFINHPDHRAAGQATLDAVFPMARDHMTFPELMEEGLEPHVTQTVLLVNFNDHNFYVDISGVIDTKLAALAAHKSQMGDMKSVEKIVRNMARDCGQECDCDCAEGYIKIDVQNS
ncbi:MAG: uncharacterized protein JWO41_784 [Candidatus Saccharibacteria bacterium]|nr:uncharacterized protein [Candidatus Saccharibacteria bacterium]